MSYTREGLLAIVGEVSVNLPGFSKVEGSLYEHGRGTERLETNDNMSEMKFGLEIESYSYIFLSIFGLPPIT